MRLFLLLVWTILVTASSVVGGLVPDQSRYFATRTGDVWTMDFSLTTADGNVQKATMRRRMGEEVELDGKKYYRMTDVMDGPFKGQTEGFVGRDAKGAFVRTDDGQEHPNAVFPLKIGQT